MHDDITTPTPAPEAGDLRPRILLAEDDAALRTLLAMLLRRDGYVVDEVSSGVELLLRLTVGEGQGLDLPALVLSDVRMPGCTGLQVLEVVRRSAFATPVILVTAFPDAQTCEAALDLGAAVVEKPFDLASLRTLVRQALHG